MEAALTMVVDPIVRSCHRLAWIYSRDYILVRLVSLAPVESETSWAGRVRMRQPNMAGWTPLTSCGSWSRALGSTDSFCPFPQSGSDFAIVCSKVGQQVGVVGSRACQLGASRVTKEEENSPSPAKVKWLRATDLQEEGEQRLRSERKRQI